ncbi:MAG: energy transducer TonB [Bacteroidia bacterium]
MNFDERMEGNLEEEIPEIYLFEEPDLKEFSCIFITEEEPVPLNLDEVRKMIGYPQIALKAEIKGNVVAKVFLDKKGFYKKHKIINQVHPILSEAVEAHIGKLRFNPVQINGKAVSGVVNIPFIFAIEK